MYQKAARKPRKGGPGQELDPLQIGSRKTSSMFALPVRTCQRREPLFYLSRSVGVIQDRALLQSFENHSIAFLVLCTKSRILEIDKPQVNSGIQIRESDQRVFIPSINLSNTMKVTEICLPNRGNDSARICGGEDTSVSVGCSKSCGPFQKCQAMCYILTLLLKVSLLVQFQASERSQYHSKLRQRSNL